MTHNHDHDHARHAHAHGPGDARRRLFAALVFTASFMVVEVVAGLLSGSLALLSDAGHMLTDAGALVLALWAQSLGARPRSDSKTFGYRRAEILAAAANGVVLGATAIAVVVEAIRRFATPQPIHGRAMLVVAVAGLVINLASAWILSRGGNDLNTRAAAAHVLADAAGSVAAMIAAILILTLGWTFADPAISIVISAVILVSAWRLLRDATHVLMQGTPDGLDVAALGRLVRDTAGVSDVHDLHVWSILGDAPVITAHVVVNPGAHGVEVARDVGKRIERALGPCHVTVQPESFNRDGALVPASALSPRARR